MHSASRVTHALMVTLAAALLTNSSVAYSQTTYRQPPAAMMQVMEAPAPPVGSLSPDRKWLLVTVNDPRSTTIADLAEPAYFLAGSRVNPKPDSRIQNIGIRSAVLRSVQSNSEHALGVPAGGRIGNVEWAPDGSMLAYTTIAGGRMSLVLLDPATNVSHELRPASGRIRDLNWSRDARHLAFTVATPAGVALWATDRAAAKQTRLTTPSLNYVDGGCIWIGATPKLLCRMNAADRGEEPPASDLPSGPIVQESYGRSSPARTYEYLLQSPRDEQLFDYHYTNQLAVVGLDGTTTPIGKPGAHIAAQPSPSGAFFLVETVHRPYSYQLPLNAFPSRIEIWSPTGVVVREIVDTKQPEEAPSARDAELPGIRSVTWRSDAPATLVLVEALDGGDPKVTIPKRDRVSLLPAPFTNPPATLAETENRYGGIVWAFPDVAFLNERSSRTGRIRTWVIDPSQPAGGTPRVLWERSSEDRYADPGTFVTARDAASGRMIPLRSSDNRWLYLRGAGASAEGDRPFLDRLEIATGKKERLWQSAAPYYETLIHLADNDAAHIVTQRESVTEPPNFYLRDVRAGSSTQLTHLGDPAPWFAKVQGEIITYKRDDGVQLSATMYLPPGYNKSQGRLPFYFWAYPREFLSADAASQVVGSPYQFRRPPRQNHLLLLTQGYGVLDGPAMPIVSKDGKEPNDSYVEQLVADARAAIDKIVELGVGDRERVGVGGHSYGAFMTANLLAHSRLFRAGIAESGAYNRSLTPFGFQAEPRTYWQAQGIYEQMSPFNYADKIKDPILLIHGQRDDNSGTFPIQSERLFAAIKGNGGNVRYVQLPLEPHGYSALETQRHVAWEMVNWLDKYVKNAKTGVSTPQP
jgi:dipeptidyl aminopeptidase/acylaminoacyl peptidase